MSPWCDLNTASCPRICFNNWFSFTSTCTRIIQGWHTHEMSLIILILNCFFSRFCIYIVFSFLNLSYIKDNIKNLFPKRSSMCDIPWFANYFPTTGRAVTCPCQVQLYGAGLHVPLCDSCNICNHICKWASPHTIHQPSPSQRSNHKIDNFCHKVK